MRKLIAVLLVVSLLGGMAVLGSSIATGAGSDGKAAPPVKTRKVKLGDDFYQYPKITIYTRDSVKWIWVDATGNPGATASEHTVTERDDRFPSSEYLTSGSFKRKFKKAGTFNILCATHPNTMKMKVRVKRRPS